MRSYFLFPFLILVSIIGCKKNNVDDNTVSKIDTLTLSSAYLICDDTSGANLINYNFLLVATANWVPVYFKIDVNNDQVPDFRFVSEIIGTAGSGYHPHSHIQSLSSITKFSGYLKNDTSFYSNTVNYHPVNPPLVVHSIIYNYSCYNLTGIDSIVSVKNNFKVSALYAGDSVNSNYFYKSDSLLIIDDDVSWGSTGATINDTMTIYTHNSFVECDQFPMDSIRFIGFKTKVNSIDKYGWVKLSITDKNKIFIYSMAIQK